MAESSSNSAGRDNIGVNNATVDNAMIGGFGNIKNDGMINFFDLATFKGLNSQPVEELSIKEKLCYYFATLYFLIYLAVSLSMVVNLFISNADEVDLSATVFCFAVLFSFRCLKKENRIVWVMVFLMYLVAVILSCVNFFKGIYSANGFSFGTTVYGLSIVLLTPITILNGIVAFLGKVRNEEASALLAENEER